MMRNKNILQIDQTIMFNAKFMLINYDNFSELNVKYLIDSCK